MRKLFKRILSRKKGNAARTSDAEGVIPLIKIEQPPEEDNAPIALYDELSSGDGYSPEEALEMSVFDREMLELGYPKVDTGEYEIKELDFSRLDELTKKFSLA